MFTIRSLAASLASVIGFTCATALSHPGKKLIGKNAVLVNIIGNVRKFTIAKKLSVLLMEMAIPVTMQRRR